MPTQTSTAVPTISFYALAMMLCLVLTGCKDISQPYKMVDELMRDPAPFKGKDMKVHGQVEPGSIQETVVAQEMRSTFVLQKEGKKITVVHIGPKPDTFRDLSDVVASGILVESNGEYTFEAKELQAKCPSKYEGAQINKDLVNDPKYRIDNPSPGFKATAN